MEKPDHTTPTLPNNNMPQIVGKVFDEVIVKQFTSQPAWLRALVYFMFVVFVTVSRLVGGKYALKGVVWKGDEWAANCEIMLNGEFFGTNSRGEYHVTVS